MSEQEYLRQSAIFPEVAVLLATHKPTPVVKEQIDSIYSQELVKVKVYWGDDRSDEESKEYVRSLLKGKNYVEIKDTGIGAAKNFLHLLRFPTEPYIAFSDQDDIWLPRKLAQHVELLKNSSELPALSHSNSLLYEGGKVHLKNSVCGSHTFYELSWQNCVQGCTMMINSKAQSTLNVFPQNHVLAHDWWIAQVISLCGSISINENGDTLYRIHEGNSIGNPRFFERVKLSFSRSGEVQSNQALEILESQNPYSSSNFNELTRMKNYWESIMRGNIVKRFVIAFSDKRARKNVLEDTWRRIMLIIRSP